MPASIPPSIGKVAPVMNDDAGEHSQTTAAATSSGPPIRRIGSVPAAQ